ncbi:hypothetical protein [Streptomyces sp. NPDC020607]|uniref:hypothetical protein n=1 Tax=Streptomyces sp. NPDC020607 TaxID=3365082 RepID=UPI00378E0E55
MSQRTDSERVLGQIERGEIRVGRDAAREIAARAEAAYGAAWHRGPRADHATVAEQARTQPGTWVLVGEYCSHQSANATAWVIRTAGRGKPGSGRFYIPAGAFEAEMRMTELGCQVLARFVSEPEVTVEDEAWADALASLSGGAA